MSIYNKDELEAPSWINQEYLENVLRHYENNQHVKVDEIFSNHSKVTNNASFVV